MKRRLVGGRRPGLLALAGAALLLGAGPPARPAAGPPAPDVVVPLAVSASGFEPRTVKVGRGQTVRFEVRALDREHCFALDAFRVEKKVVPGRLTTVDVTPGTPGRFPFYCCLETGRAAETERGELVVVG